MKNHHNKEIDLDGLKQHYKENPLFRTLMDFLAKQLEDESELTVDELADRLKTQGLDVGYHDARRMLQALDGRDCGRFTIGRRGWSSRFTFDVSMTELAKEVSGRSTVVPMTPAPMTLTHKFRLRPTLEVSFELPEDLTDKEVGRIADFLKTLPFEHAGSSAAA